MVGVNNEYGKRIYVGVTIWEDERACIAERHISQWASVPVRSERCSASDAVLEVHSNILASLTSTSISTAESESLREQSLRLHMVSSLCRLRIGISARLRSGK